MLRYLTALPYALPVAAVGAIVAAVIAKPVGRRLREHPVIVFFWMAKRVRCDRCDSDTVRARAGIERWFDDDPSLGVVVPGPRGAILGQLAVDEPAAFCAIRGRLVDCSFGSATLSGPLPLRRYCRLLSNLSSTWLSRWAEHSSTQRRS